MLIQSIRGTLNMADIALTSPSGNTALSLGSDQQKFDQGTTSDKPQQPNRMPSGAIAQVPRTQAAMPLNAAERTTRHEVAHNSGFNTEDADRWALLQRVIQTAPAEMRGKAQELQSRLDILSRNVVDDQRTVDRAASDPLAKIWFTPANGALNSATTSLHGSESQLSGQRREIDGFLEQRSTFPYYQNPVQPNRTN
jgi:hypothetical protein